MDEIDEDPDVDFGTFADDAAARDWPVADEPPDEPDDACALEDGPATIEELEAEPSPRLGDPDRLNGP